MYKLRKREEKRQIKSLAVIASLSEHKHTVNAYILVPVTYFVVVVVVVNYSFLFTTV